MTNQQAKSLIVRVHDALREVMDPELHKGIVEMGMVHDLAEVDGLVTLTLALTTMGCPLKSEIQSDVRQAALGVEGVRDVAIDLREMTAEEKQRALGGSPEPAGMAVGYNCVKQVIAVASGKGGVGKSSVAAQLAVALRRRGHTVGLLDADVTGPSIPRMLLPSAAPRPVGSAVGIVPVETAGGIKVMSISLLLEDPNAAVIWRGPLISGAIRQFWNDVAWGALDYLVLDLPPGTSDAALTVMQAIPLNGVLLVMTPQGLAGMVMRKAASLASQLDVPVLGLVENMSYVECPGCGERMEVFGPSMAVEMAASLGVPLLGRLPIDPQITARADAGRMEEHTSEAFEALVDRMLVLVPERASRPIA